MPTQDPTAVSPTAPVPAARGRGAGLSVEITRGSNPPNAFFPLLRDVRCPVRRARVCAEKRNSRAKPRPGELLHAAWNSRKEGLFFIFLMLHFFPTQSPITLRFHLVLAAYFAIRKLKAHRHSIHSSSAQLVKPARKPQPERSKTTLRSCSHHRAKWPPDWTDPARSTPTSATHPSSSRACISRWRPPRASTAASASSAPAIRSSPR